MPEHELVFLQRPDFELADVPSVEKQICKHAPELVISAAANTDVDGGGS